MRNGLASMAFRIYRRARRVTNGLASMAFRIYRRARSVTNGLASMAFRIYRRARRVTNVSLNLSSIFRSFIVHFLDLNVNHGEGG